MRNVITKFDVIDSEEKAYWLGFIHADGHIRNRSLEVELQVKDIDHLNKLNMFMTNGICEIKYRPNKNTYRILINSKYLCDKLRSIKIKDSSIFEIIPDKFKISFIRGVFDGDGSIGKDRIDIIGYTELIEKFKKYLNVGRIEYECYKNISRIYIYGLRRGNAKNILSQIYNNASIFLDRKYNLALSLCK